MDAKAHRLCEQAAVALAATELDLANRLFEEALALGHSWYVPRCLIGQATVQRSNDRPLRSIALLRRAGSMLDGWDRQGVDNDLARDARFRYFDESACTYLKLGVPDVAFEFQQELWRHAKTPHQRYAATLTRLDVLFSRFDWQPAINLATKALEDEELCSVEPRAASTIEFRRLFAASRLARDPEESIAIADQLRRLAARTRTGADDTTPTPELHELDRWRATLVAADLSTVAGRIDDAAAIHATLRVPPTDAAKHRAEMLAQRARIAMARGTAPNGLAPLRAELGDAVAEWLDAWAAMELRDGGVGALHYYNHRRTLATQLALDRHVLTATATSGAAFDAAFAHLETALNLGSLARRFGRGPATPVEARELMPENGGILAFLFGPDSGSLLLIDGDGTAHFTVDFGSGWEARNQALLDAVDRPPGRFTTDELAATERLAEQVANDCLPLDARTRLAKWQSMVLIGHEKHARLIQSLRYDGEWLCNRKAITHLPSASVGLSLRARAERRKAQRATDALDLMVIGDPTVDAAATKRWHVSSLDMSTARRAALVAGVPNHRAFWADAATVAALTSMPASSVEVLCLFTHGVHDYSRERSAGLLLVDASGRTGAFFADFIEKLVVPPIVLLPVCQAASGPERMGEDGANHLGGAFLFAGADCVVLAHGDLSVGATRDLLARALTELRGGHAMAEALRRARVEIAKSPERAHPYFFAGLRHVGLDRGLELR